MSTQVLDTHFHLWRAPGATYEWVDTAIAHGLHFLERGTLPSQFVLEEYERIWAGLDVIPFVHVEAGAAQSDALLETTWLASRRNAKPSRFVVFADLRSPTLREDLLRQCAVDPRVVGVRQMVTWSPDPSITFAETDIMRDPAWERGLDVVGELDLAFDLQVYPEQADWSAGIAARHGDVRFILNHALLPLLDGAAAAAEWRRALGTLAAHPNVAMKLGGLSMRNPALTVRDAADAMNECVDAFGVDRTMFGTNSPVETARTSPSQVAAAMHAVLDRLQTSEADALARDSALAWYRPSATSEPGRSGEVSTP